MDIANPRSRMKNPRWKLKALRKVRSGHPDRHAFFPFALSSRTTIRRFTEGKLIAILAQHVTNADDIRYLAEHIENQECRYEMAKRMRFRPSRLSRAA